VKKTNENKKIYTLDFSGFEKCRVYTQSTGEFLINGSLIATGYSGAPGHINNTSSECTVNKGPLPRGRYRMTYEKEHNKGKHVIVLTPMPETAMCGRHSMLIHGDNKRLNNTGSEGCIILPINIRLRIRDEVIRGNDILRVK